jgi:hypothetical protein
MAETMAFRWANGGFFPADRFIEPARQTYVEGAVYWLGVEPERTDKTHNHEFAWLTEAWKTLPDHIAADYPNAEVLRKRALIATGWCNVKDYPCASKAEAERLRRTLEAELDAYAAVIVRDDVVRVCRAKSQARNRMKAAEFQQSKTDILRWVSDLLGVAPEALSRARAA